MFKSFGDAVLAARGSFDQRRFAKFLTVSQAAVGYWERGQRLPTGPRVEQIARLVAKRLRSLGHEAWTTKKVLELIQQDRDERRAA